MDLSFLQEMKSTLKNEALVLLHMGILGLSIYLFGPAVGIVLAIVCSLVVHYGWREYPQSIWTRILGIATLAVLCAAATVVVWLIGSAFNALIKTDANFATTIIEGIILYVALFVMLFHLWKKRSA